MSNFVAGFQCAFMLALALAGWGGWKVFEAHREAETFNRLRGAGSEVTWEDALWLDLAYNLPDVVANPGPDPSPSPSPSPTDEVPLAPLPGE